MENSLTTGKFVTRTLLAIGAFVICIGAFFYIQFEGGIVAIRLNQLSAPDEQSEQFLAERANAEVEVINEIESLLAQSEFSLLATSTNDYDCEKGQNNYKRSDGYAYRCTVSTHVLLGHDGEDNGLYVRADSQLSSSGWEVTRWTDSLDEQLLNRSERIAKGWDWGISRKYQKGNMTLDFKVGRHGLYLPENAPNTNQLFNVLTYNGGSYSLSGKGAERITAYAKQNKLIEHVELSLEHTFLVIK